MFIGREEELKQIKKYLFSPEPAIIVVYGRRRIGKTELIRNALKDKSYLSFEGLENRSSRSQIQNFLSQLYFQIEDKYRENKNCRSWNDVLLQLVSYVRQNPCPIFIDEFQWTANNRNELLSEIKMIWDQYLKQIPGVSLILCGSIASFMVNKVLKSKALYGRINLQLKVNAFTLKETTTFLGNRGLNEVIEAQMFSGGIPEYLKQLSNAPSIRMALDDIAFKKTGIWLIEYEKIFLSHFGKNKNYEKIIALLGAIPYGLYRSDIFQKLKIKAGGQFSKILLDLKNAGFITSFIPVDKKNQTNNQKFILTDSYIRFYFAFIQPNLNNIEKGLPENLFKIIMQKSSFYSWLGISFEFLCLQHAGAIASILGFAGIEFEVGPYFKASDKTGRGVQIDLVFNRIDNVITICEVKYSINSIGKSIIEEVEKKVDVLQNIFPNKTIQKVLITLSNPTSELEASGYFYKIISAKELI